MPAGGEGIVESTIQLNVVLKILMNISKGGIQMEEKKHFQLTVLLFIFILVCIPGALIAQSGTKKSSSQMEAGKPSGQMYDNSAKADEVRRKNIETIKKFLALDGVGDTDQFFTDGGSFEQTFPFYGDAPTKMVVNKNQAQAAQPAPQQQAAVSMPELTIDWKFYNETVYYTNDPNYIIIENYGSGKQLAQNGEYVPYSNHYFHTFRMESGLIKEYREITNPLSLYKAFSIPVGHMPTPDETMKAATTARKGKAAVGK
jgi:ketosteroid isomerase-like protein